MFVVQCVHKTMSNKSETCRPNTKPIQTRKEKKRKTKQKQVNYENIIDD